MRTSILITPLLASVFLLTACGQKGPLYIPSRPTAPPPATASTSAPTTAQDAADKAPAPSSGTHP